MRSAYPAVFLCALACASVPSTARLSSTGAAAPAAASVASSGGTASSLGSSEGARAYKPHLAIFERLSEAIGVPKEEILYVGDSPFADVIPDGTINAIDLSLPRGRLNNRLPGGEPAAATALLFGRRPNGLFGAMSDSSAVMRGSST